MEDRCIKRADGTSGARDFEKADDDGSIGRTRHGRFALSIRGFIQERRNLARKKKDIDATLYRACTLAESTAEKTKEVIKTPEKNKMAALGGVSSDIRETADVLESLPREVRSRHEIKKVIRKLEEISLLSSRATDAVFRRDDRRLKIQTDSISSKLKEVSRALMDCCAG